MESRNDSSISYINHLSSAISRTDAHVYRNPISNPSQNLDQNHFQDSNPDPDPKPTSNGASNSKKPSSPPAPPPPPPLQHQLQEEGVRYRECLKNHAASMGTRVVDGCGEFMPNGEEGTPEALKCAACDCHRNFHRKEENGVYPLAVLPPPPPQPPRHSHSLFTMPPPPPPPPQQQRHHHHHHHHHRNKNNGPTTPIMMSFGGVYGGGGAAAESSSEDLNNFHCNKEGRTSLNKKRFRTKFTQEQKEKMHEFAEKVGWKFQKHDEQELKQFCEEVGIKRQVLKVWMHNNKQAMKKKEI